MFAMIFSEFNYSTMLILKACYLSPPNMSYSLGAPYPFENIIINILLNQWIQYNLSNGNNLIYICILTHASNSDANSFHLLKQSSLMLLHIINSSN